MQNSQYIGNWNSIMNMDTLQQYQEESSDFQSMEEFLSLNKQDDDIVSQFMYKKEIESMSENEEFFKTFSQQVTEKSKRIMKRQKAKKRNSKKDLINQSQCQILRIDKEERFELPDDLESQCPTMKKKIQQKIKNRISAQNSRDKQKEYIRSLEEENRILKAQNLELQQQQGGFNCKQEETCQSESLSISNYKDKTKYSSNMKQTVLLFVIFALLISIPRIQQNLVTLSGDKFLAKAEHKIEPYFQTLSHLLPQSSQLKQISKTNQQMLMLNQQQEIVQLISKMYEKQLQNLNIQF